MPSHRTFVAGILLVACEAFLAQTVSAQPPPLTARQVIERITTNLKGEWSDDGIDSFKDGDPGTTVTGVAVTMMATMDVLQRAATLGLNLIITHEPTFYSHQDRLTTLEREQDAVTATKRAFIREHHLVVWRLHDHWHFPSRNPDPVVTGVFRALDWQRYQRTPDQNPIVLPEITVAALASDIKKRLGVRTMRVVGDSSLHVTKVGFLPGFPGFDLHRRFLQRDDVEVLVMGEAHEWETILYAADAVAQGRHKALIVLGHIPSEQAGSEEVVRWLQPLVPNVPVKLLAAAEPFWSAK